jgi:hypothetical protein
MTMLKNETKHSAGAEHDKNGDRQPVPPHDGPVVFDSRVIEEASIAQAFPATSNNESGLAGVTAQVVTRANRAGNVGRTRQVLAICCTAERGVATGSWRGPRSEAPVSGDQGQRVLRIDGANRGPRQVHGAQYIADFNTTVAHGHARGPVASPRDESDKGDAPAVPQRVSASALHDHQNNDESREPDHCHCQYLTEAGTVNHGLAHAPIVARVHRSTATVAAARQDEMQVIS